MCLNIRVLIISYITLFIPELLTPPRKGDAAPEGGVLRGCLNSWDFTQSQHPRSCLQSRTVHEEAKVEDPRCPGLQQRPGSHGNTGANLSCSLLPHSKPDDDIYSARNQQPVGAALLPLRVQCSAAGCSWPPPAHSHRPGDGSPVQRATSPPLSAWLVCTCSRAMANLPPFCPGLRLGKEVSQEIGNGCSLTCSTLQQGSSPRNIQGVSFGGPWRLPALPSCSSASWAQRSLTSCTDVREAWRAQD